MENIAQAVVGEGEVRALWLQEAEGAAGGCKGEGWAMWFQGQGRGCDEVANRGGPTMWLQKVRVRGGGRAVWLNMDCCVRCGCKRLARLVWLQEVGACSGCGVWASALWLETESTCALSLQKGAAHGVVARGNLRVLLLEKGGGRGAEQICAWRKGFKREASVGCGCRRGGRALRLQ